MTPGRRPDEPSVPASASSRTCEPSPPIWCSRPGPPSLRPCAPDNPHPSSATDSPHPIYPARDPSNQWTANARTLKMRIAGHLGQVFHDLARRKECRIEEGHLMPDHVHMLISIPPKYSVAQIIGYMKGKSSIWIAQNVERKMRNFLGHKFWARGYFVTTVGRDEEVIRAYIRNQELADRQLEQFELKISAAQNPINRPNIP